MLGSLYAVEVVRGDDGCVVVTVRESDTHSDPVKVDEYRADDDLIERISGVIDRVGMKEWDELPQSEFIALDAATESLRMEFESADPDKPGLAWISYSSNDELPDGGDSMREIYDMIMANTGEDRLVREFIEEN